MKKIIIINQYGVTPDVPGATKHYDMAEHFAEKHTYKIEYWLSGLNHKTGTNHKTLKGLKWQSTEQKKNNFKIVRIKGISYGANLLLRQISIMLFDIITAFKILFARDIQCVVLNTPPISILNVMATKLKGKKIIIDVEDLWPLFLIELGMENKIAIKYMESCSRYSYKVADKISAVSKGMLEYVKEISGERKEVWLSPLGINVKEFMNKNKNNELIKKKSWKNDFKIMYLGAHGRANDLLSVLDTIHDYNIKFGNKIRDKSISFIFIGDGDQKINIVNYSKELNLNNVFFEEAVPGSLVSDYLIHADICLTNLMKIESFKLVRPNKLFQYMALGKPIISGIWGEFQEIIEEENTGIYVDFSDIEKASSLIYKLINDEDRLKEMGLNGENYIRNYGDRDKIFDRYYSKIINMED